ncbi:MAG: glycosyltransferase [Nitrospirota bacterium]
MISVVIPAYKEERALPNTLRALFTQQGEFEVIVVDGGSTDRTLNVLREFGFIPDASYRTFHVSRFTLRRAAPPK